MAVSQSLTLTETSVDTLANLSKVKIVWKSTQTGESYNLNERTANYWITINGGAREEYSVRYTLPLRATTTILSTTITVPHTEEGTGSVKVETWMDTRISAGEIRLEKTLGLTPIARSSAIGATDAYIESTSAISINRKSDAYTHSIQFSFADLVGYIDGDGNITDVEVKLTNSSIPFKITSLFYGYMPDKASDICELICRTYNGSELIGSKYTSFTIKANPDLCSPLIQCAVKDVNQKTVALTGNPDILVRYASKAHCTISAEAVDGASIRNMKVNGYETGSTYEIDAVETGSFDFTVEDSRGFVTKKTVSKTLLPYIPVTLNAKVTRTDPTSGNAVLEASGQCYGKSFGAASNRIDFEYSINGAAKKAATVVISEDGMQYSVREAISDLHYMSSSTVVVTLRDALSEKTQTVTVKPGIPVFDWGERDFAFHVPISMNGGKISHVKSPTDDMDAANKAYVDNRMPGVVAPVNGFFTLSVDENGDLWAHTSGDGTVPEFEYDSGTGNLYFITE